MATDHFKQIKPGPRPADEPNGASDILAFYNLRRLHDLTQSGTFVRQQQEQARQSQQQGGGIGGGGVPGDARLWKRGQATGLAPLASKPAPSVPAGSRPGLPVAPLARSLASLGRGPWALPGDGGRGELLVAGGGSGGEESAAAVLLPAAAASKGGGGGGGVGGGGGAATAAAAAGAAPQQALSPGPPPGAAGAAGAAAAAAASPARPKIKLKVKLGGAKKN